MKIIKWINWEKCLIQHLTINIKFKSIILYPHWQRNISFYLKSIWSVALNQKYELSAYYVQNIAMYIFRNQKVSLNPQVSQSSCWELRLKPPKTVKMSAYIWQGHSQDSEDGNLQWPHPKKHWLWTKTGNSPFQTQSQLSVFSEENHRGGESF